MSDPIVVDGLDPDDEWYMSASQLKKYSACALQYEFGYVKDLEAPDIKTPPLIIGTAVHETVEGVLERYGMPDFDDPDVIREMLDDEYTEPDYVLPSWAEDRIDECLDGVSRFIAGQDAEIRGVEQEIKYPYDRVDGDPQPMYAICDVVTDDVIWDWKTGQVRPKDEQLQAGVYAAAYEAAYGEEVDQVKFVYLTEGEARPHYPSDELYGYVTYEVEGIRDSVENSEFPASPGDPCSWCSYEGYCSESLVGLGGMDYYQW